MEPLKFGKPIFRKGLNITVRLGTKWFDNFYLNRHDVADSDAAEGVPLQVDIQNSDGSPVGKGQIEAVQVVSFYDIPPHLLILEHDPECRTLDGLYKGMKGPYGDKFNAGSMVTLVFFTVNGL